jgi:hypothetical protein
MCVLRTELQVRLLNPLLQLLQQAAAAAAAAATTAN